MDARQNVTRTSRMWSALALLLVLPFTIGPKGIKVNEAACAETGGTCCPDLNAICNIGAGDHEHYYAKLEGGRCP